jgi:hypothetical protein
MHWEGYLDEDKESKRKEGRNYILLLLLLLTVFTPSSVSLE